MKTKILLSFLLLNLSLVGFSQSVTITNSGFTFSPSSVTITSGQSVIFNIASPHNVVEVSLATWNANDNSALPGGFQLPFGGGTLSAAQLTVGTHYYVCSPHASLGMKGIIIVQEVTTGIDENQLSATFSISPNPSNGKFKLLIDESKFVDNSKLVIYNLQGKQIYQSVISNPKSEIDISNQKKGIYFIKAFIDGAIITKKILIQ